MTYPIPIGILKIKYVQCDKCRKISKGANMNQKTNNRELILDCALDLFYRKGYEGVGVQEIATKAGVTKPTLYHYFKSKYGLLESLLSEKVDPILDSLSLATDIQADFSHKLFKMAENYFDMIFTNKEVFFFMLGLQYASKESDGHKAIKPYALRLMKLFTDVFDRESSYLGNMNGRQEQFAIGFMGILNYYLLVYYERNADKEVMSVISQGEITSLVHQFMHGIFS